MKLKRIIFLTFITFFAMSIIANAQSDYVLDKDDNRVPTPKSFVVKKEIKFLGEAGFFNNPTDMFIDKNDNIFVCDTGNSRIVKLNPEGNIVNVFTGGESKPLLNPEGVFVGDTGAIYVSDTGNNRIVHLSASGKYITNYNKPSSSLIEGDYTFAPSKLGISNTGFIYIIRLKSLMMIDSENNFQGYIGTPEVGFNINQLFVKIFASKEQKRKLEKIQPPPFLSFEIESDGIIYASSLDNKYGQIKKINSVGKNIFPKKQYGEVMIGKNGMPIYPKFVDLTVDKQGIISIVEQETRCVYQYDQEGSLLTVFGGHDDKKGGFDTPVSICTDSKGRLYILDKTIGNIQIFEPTNYISLIHKAISSYYNGNYKDSLEQWNKVLLINANLDIAHEGVTKVSIKNKQYKAAMVESKKAGYKDLYSIAFAKYRHEIFKNNFFLVIITTLILIVLIVVFVIYIRRLSGNIINEFIFSNRSKK